MKWRLCVLLCTDLFPFTSFLPRFGGGGVSEVVFIYHLINCKWYCWWLCQKVIQSYNSSPSPKPVHWGSFLLTMINAGENVLLMVSLDSVIAETKVKYFLGIWYILKRIKGHDNSLHYSCLENSMDKGALWTTVHGITKSQTGTSDEHFSYVNPTS